VAAPTDRYEPLPGLLGLPGHFVRKLSPGGRKFAALIGVLLLAGAVTAVIIVAPRVQESKGEHDAAERAARVRASKQARARLIAEQRPRLGRLDVHAGADGGGVAALLEAAITRDARRRAARGELGNRARYTSCRRLRRERKRLLLACTAVTSKTEAAEDVPGIVVGYSYRAAVSTTTGRFAFCKASSRPLGTSSPRELRALSLPHVCGGSG
jgi:hypothetical protein